MHMADALLAPQVAVTMYGLSAVAAGVSIKKIRDVEISNEVAASSKLPEMAVMSALVFAGQMINYTIPGTGSSGHLCGGMMLSAILGPYAGFLSMIAVLLIQCLFFADGGLMAFGANVWNMAFYGCFLGYFLIYRPIVKKSLAKNEGKSSARIGIILASVLGCVLTLQLGAASVALETTLSGITELPILPFLGLMQPIHLAIGLVEGIITAAVLVFIYESRPEMITDGLYATNVKSEHKSSTYSKKFVIISLAVVALVVGGVFSIFASGNPDGLEWSLFGNADGGYSANMGLDEEEYGVVSSLGEGAQQIVDKTAFMPDYGFKSGEESNLGTQTAGVVGSVMVAAFAGVICIAGGAFRKKQLS